MARIINVSYEVPDDYTYDDFEENGFVMPEEAEIVSYRVLDDDDIEGEDQYLLYLIEFAHEAPVYKYKSPMLQQRWRKETGIMRARHVR